jgi:hypothetical protein
MTPAASWSLILAVSLMFVFWMKAAAVITDPKRQPCGRCGHTREWHRTERGSCTASVSEVTQNAATWNRCDCPGFLMRRPS